jgi:hypothetical protein
MNSKQLSILPENKTSVFYSPVEGPNVLVRTGTSSDNSFLHSILQASSKDYSKLDQNSKNSLVQKFIKNLHSKEWDSLKISNTSINDLFKNSIKNNVNYRYISLIDSVNSNYDIIILSIIIIII